MGAIKTMMTDIDILENMLNSIEKSNLEVKAVSAAAPIVEKAMKKELSQHHRAERDPTRGELVESIGIGYSKKKTYAFVGPTGVDSKGVRNGEKLAYLEYGTINQVGTPVMGKIVAETRYQVRDEMQRVIMQEAGQ